MFAKAILKCLIVLPYKSLLKDFVLTDTTATIERSDSLKHSKEG